MYFHNNMKCHHMYVTVTCHHAESDNQDRNVDVQGYMAICFLGPLITAFSAETLTEMQMVITVMKKKVV